MRRLASSLAALTAVVLVAGCGVEDTPLPDRTTPPDVPAAAPPSCTNDNTTLQSWAPSEQAALAGPDGGAVQRIRDAGRIRIGVSADTYRMAAQAGDSSRLEGFDISIAKEIAIQLLGADQLGKKIIWKVITATDRIPDLQADEKDEKRVDMVVRNMTITCDRWEQVAFSAEYYHATQKVLVRADLAGYDSDGDGVDDTTKVPDLNDRKVCAPYGSTSLVNIRKFAPKADLVPAVNHTGCLVLLQQGKVDAITGDDTVLAGLAAQDPYAVVPEIQPENLEPPYGEPYGVAVNSDDGDLAAFINGVLEQMGRSGEWDRLYHRWLDSYLGSKQDGYSGATQPDPAYGRPLP